MGFGLRTPPAAFKRMVVYGCRFVGASVFAVHIQVKSNTRWCAGRCFDGTAKVLFHIFRGCSVVTCLHIQVLQVCGVTCLLCLAVPFLNHIPVVRISIAVGTN